MAFVRAIVPSPQGNDLRKNDGLVSALSEIDALSRLSFLLFAASSAAGANWPQRTGRQASLQRRSAIFEDPGRAQKLQVERVMDLLGSTGSLWRTSARFRLFTVRSARRVGTAAPFTPSTSIPHTSAISNGGETREASADSNGPRKPNDPTLPRAGVAALCSRRITKLRSRSCSCAVYAQG